MKLEEAPPAASGVTSGEDDHAAGSSAVAKPKRHKKAVAPNPLAMRPKSKAAVASTGAGVTKKTRRKRSSAVQQAVGD